MSKKNYALVESERIFKDKVLISYYMKPLNPVEKTFVPYDTADGYRVRLNKETGELIPYTRQQCDYSKDCSVRRTKILLSMLLACNSFDWFVTLTFDDSKVENRCDDVIVYNTYRKFIQRIKKRFPKLGYISVPERHEKNDAIHFHMLLQMNGYNPIKDLGFNLTDKVCCSWSNKNGIASKAYFEKTKHLKKLKETDGESIYNILQFPYGFSTASRIVNPDACKSYVKKYISKDLGASTDTFKKRFYYSSNLNVPEVVKRYVGADFENPVSINELTDTYLNNINILETNNADVVSYYNKDFNVKQYWVDKTKYEEFKKDDHLVPVESSPFDEPLLTVQDDFLDYLQIFD